MPSVVAFLVAVAFWPGISGAATSPRWAIAAVSLWFVDWRVLPFVAVCFAVLEFDAACHWAIVSAALCWGLNVSRETTEQSIRAFAVGIAVSGVVAVTQTFGWSGIYQIAAPAGLFLNKNLMGEAAALGFIAAVCARLWPAALLTIPALILSTSRASLLAVTLGLILLTNGRWRYLLLATSLVAASLLYAVGPFDSASLVQRLLMWQQAIDQLKWWGNGSYHLVAPTWTEAHLHNDWLQLAFELGVVGIAPMAVVLAAGVSSTFCPFIAALVVIGCFGFPLHAPATAWFGAFIVGVALRHALDERRVLLRTRLDNAQPRRSVHCTADLSFPVLR